MEQEHFGWRVFASVLICGVAMMLGYPGVYVMTHGLDPVGWPSGVRGNPVDWLYALLQLDVRTLALTYVHMLMGRALALPDGGRTGLMILVACTAASIVVVMVAGGAIVRRHPSGRFGNAQWASRSERGRMTEGLEIGLDPDTGRALRIAVEGNLIAIAPPRTGKTSGLFLTNLTFPEVGSYGGPAVVIDPKGECYRSVRRRREEIGKEVRCLDPLNLVGGTDLWNPILEADPTDILYLQSVARALLPAADSTSENSAYFRGRAVTVIVAALRSAILSGERSLMEAARLLGDPVGFAQELEGSRDRLSRSALAILNSDERTRNPILQSAEQVFEWCLDERLQTVVTGNTFQMSDLRSGEVDLFIVLPSGVQGEILAPYLRWILADLFNAFRKKRAATRLIVYIDESFVVGRCEQILKGFGELPGYGISMYLIWHSIGQLSETYGKNGANILLGTAEVVTLFNLSKALPEETEHWSKALGSFSASTPSNERRNAGEDAVEQRLVPASDLAGLTRRSSISFVTSSRYTANPILAQKTFAHTDRRFRSLLDPIPPAGPA